LSADLAHDGFRVAILTYDDSPEFPGFLEFLGGSVLPDVRTLPNDQTRSIVGHQRREHEKSRE
jgi:hypothetical protein